jgi:hypothetical protein
MNDREYRLRSKIDQLRDQLNEEQIVQAAVLKDMRHRLKVAHGKIGRHAQLEQEAKNKQAFEREVQIIEDTKTNGNTDWGVYERILRQCAPESTVDISEHAATVMAAVLKARVKEAV